MRQCQHRWRERWRFKRQPALTYLTRIHRLEDLRDGIEWFDQQVVDRVLRRCIGMKNDQVLNERVVKQASLPLRLRGIALRPHLRTADAAYYAAAMMAMKYYNGFRAEDADSN